MTTDLVTFLRQALDEEERVALTATRRLVRVDTGERYWPTPRIRVAMGDYKDPEVTEALTLIDVFNPARVLAEVEAKRRILDLHGTSHECSVYDHNGDVDCCHWVAYDWCSTVRLLALPYADRPGFREEWAP